MYRIQKKCDVLFGFILLFLLVKLSTSSVTFHDCNCTPATTELDKFHGHVLRRRTRAVVFPSKTSLLLTPAFTKAILGGHPKGLFYSVEFDMYSPLPDSIEGWKPTILLKNAKQKDTFAQTVNQSIDNKTKLFSENIYNNVQEEGSPDSADNDYYTFPFQQTEESNSWKYFKSKWSHVPPSFVSRVFKNDATKIKGFTSYFHKQPFLDKNNQQSSEFKRNFLHNKKWSKTHTQDNTDRRNHLHEQSARERRQLFEQLEVLGNIFQFNIKKCIQRAKCELASNFRSYGESIIEDIVRIILNPLEAAQSFGRNNNHKNNNVNCDYHFAASCPYKVLDFLTRNTYL